MRSTDQRVVWGLGLANVIMSALGIVIWLIMAVLLAMSIPYLTDPSFYGLYGTGAYSLDSDLYYYSGLDSDALMGMMSLGFGILVGLVVWCIIASVICLIAGIFCLRVRNNPAKAGAAFGWSIAGAVLAFLGGGFSIVSTVLFVISAVFASRVRTAMMQGGWGAQPASASWQQPYYGQQPQAPYGQQPYQQDPYAPQVPQQPLQQQPQNPAYGQQPYQQEQSYQQAGTPQPYQPQPVVQQPAAQPSEQAATQQGAQPYQQHPSLQANPYGQQPANPQDSGQQSAPTDNERR